jgi:glycosyltransferase involved in cell wall biosynthesis
MTSSTAADDRAAPTRRSVVLVGNPAHPYSRGLRIARVLAGLGDAVEIAAIAGDDAPASETDGPIVTRRYRPSGPWARLWASHAAGTAPAPAPPDASGARPAGWRGWRIVRVGTKATVTVRRWLLWPHTVRGWWATLDRELLPADLYHACGSLTVAAALAARRRDRKAGRRSVVVYDAIDDVMGSNNVLGMPRLVRWWLGRRERGWARSADARLTVNDELAARLARRWGIADRPVVIPNWPEPRPLPASPNRIRERIGLSPSTRIVVFQGRLGPNLGLDEAAEAILLVPDAVLVLIGFGRWFDRSRERDADPRYAGRHVTLPAVHPDELVEWTASADVSVIPLPPVSANQRAATPNKLWESIAAGTPVVVGPELPVMAGLVRRHELGVIAASLGPSGLATAIRSVLDVAPDEAAARRRRIARVGATEFIWPVAAERYAAVVRGLRDRPSDG